MHLGIAMRICVDSDKYPSTWTGTVAWLKAAAQMEYEFMELADQHIKHISC